MAISPTGGVFSYLPHHLDLASEDSVGHSTCMSVLVRRRAIMGSIVQPKRSCLGAATGQRNPHTGGANGQHTGTIIADDLYLCIDVLVQYCCLYWFTYQVPVYFLFGDMYIHARFTVVV